MTSRRTPDPHRSGGPASGVDKARRTDLAADVLEWQYLTGPDFDAMDRENTVVIVACSPLEVHGPHLPVVTDNLEAQKLAERATELLTERHPDIRFVMLPPLYVAADVLPHPGSVAFKQGTIIRVLEDLGRSLARQGFRHIWVSSFHGGPRHFVSIEVAADRVNRRYGTKMVSVFSLLIGRLTGGETDLADMFAHIDGLERELLVGDSHGGAVETSLMLHLLGERVRDVYRELPRRTVDIRLRENGREPLGHPGGRPSFPRLMAGFREKLKFYEAETYSGAPAIASAEAGAEMMEILAGHATEALSELWTGRIGPEDCHSPVWPVRWVFTSRLVTRAFEAAMRYRNRVF